MRSRTVTVVENLHLQDSLYRLVVPYEGNARAGQFVMVRGEHSATLLPRPISICDIENGQMILLYQVVGRGTGEISRLKAGDPLQLSGPVGQGFPLDDLPKGSHIALVGGGVGTAPLVLTAKKLKERGMTADAHLGFKAKSMLLKELAPCCTTIYLSTETGEEGAKGLVTGTLNPKDYDAVFCCGPTPMMMAVVAQCEAAGTPIYVSLEQKMACGIGACRVCTCTTKEGKNMRTCVEGPVFRGEEVDFHA